MRWVRARLDRIAPHSSTAASSPSGTRCGKPSTTFFYSPSSVTTTAAHVRDAVDLKRIMMTVVMAALPCVLMAMFNTGLQANLAIDPAKAASLEAGGTTRSGGRKRVLAAQRRCQLVHGRLLPALYSSRWSSA